MTQIVFILYVILSNTLCALSLQCGPNENEVDCTSNCAQYCPIDRYSDSSCSKESGCGGPGCQCNFGYRRNNDNGTCILTTECPPFECDGPNEKYDSCPSYCSEECGQATPGGNCPLFGFLLIVVNCSPACRCMEGYCRKDGVCVPFDQKS